MYRSRFSSDCLLLVSGNGEIWKSKRLKRLKGWLGGKGNSRSCNMGKTPWRPRADCWMGLGEWPLPLHPSTPPSMTYGLRSKNPAAAATSFYQTNTKIQTGVTGYRRLQLNGACFVPSKSPTNSLRLVCKFHSLMYLLSGSFGGKILRKIIAIYTTLLNKDFDLTAHEQRQSSQKTIGASKYSPQQTPYPQTKMLVWTVTLGSKIGNWAWDKGNVQEVRKPEQSPRKETCVNQRN